MMRMIRLGILLLLLAPTSAALGQKPDLASVLAGKEAPLTIQFKDLTSGWKRIRVQAEKPNPLQSMLKSGLPAAILFPVFAEARKKASGGSPKAANSASDDMSALFGLMLLSGMGGNGSLLGGEDTVYYTQGRTVEIGGNTYLLVYQPQRRSPDLTTLFRQAQQHPDQPPDTDLLLTTPRKLEDALTLTLLDLKRTGNLTDIRPCDPQHELTDFEPTLFDVLMPVFLKARERARAVSSLSNLKQLALGILMYAQDNDEKFPPMKSCAVMKQAIFPYVKNNEAFIDPISKQPYLTNPFLTGKNMAEIDAPEKMAILFEPAPMPDGTRAVAYMDGHVVRIKEADWPRIKRASHIP